MSRIHQFRAENVYDPLPVAEALAKLQEVIDSERYEYDYSYSRKEDVQVNADEIVVSYRMTTYAVTRGEHGMKKHTYVSEYSVITDDETIEWLKNNRR
jgi:uncharacterized GH25 family protein